MAGYFTKLNGRVYEGQYPAAADLENGTFVVVNSDGKVEASGANANVELVCMEKTDLWGKKALRLRVTKEVGTVFMVEGDPNVEATEAYDDTAHIVKKDELVKMRVPHISDEIILAVSDTIYSAAAVGTAYNVAAKGEIAAAS